jgi:hypothetical protein
MRSFLHRMLPFYPGLLVTVLSVHCAMTLVYLMPLNPIVLRVAPLVERYMVPWFTQDWHLFAPDPINETRTLQISCRLQQVNGMTVETTWADVSTPLWDAQTSQRFSAAASLSRLQAQTVQFYLDRSEILAALDRHRMVENSAVNQLADAIRTAESGHRTLATRVLARLGAVYCDRWYGAGQTAATRVRLARLRFPRFSQRQLPDTEGELRYYTFDWMPYERVAPFASPDR